MIVNNNSPSTGFISWSGVQIQYQGNVYQIANGNTNLPYVFWKFADPLKFYASSAYPTLGADDLLVFLNKNGTHLKVPNTTIIDGSLIVPESIIANALSANSVTGEKILAGSIDATHLKAGSVTADALAAGVISADAMVSATPNMIGGGLDQFDQVGTVYGSTSGFSSVALSTEAYVVGGKSLKTVTPSTAGSPYKYLHPTSNTANGWLNVTAGKRYALSCFVHCPNTTAMNTQLVLVWRDAANNSLATLTFSDVVKFADGWVRIYVQGVAPANAVSATYYIRSSSASATHYWDAFQFEQLKDNATEPSEWKSAGATIINGGNIIAKTITASQINVSTLSAISANIGNITAGNISGVNIDASTFTSRDATNNVTMTLNSGSLNIGNQTRLSWGTLELMTGSEQYMSLSTGQMINVLDVNPGATGIKDLYQLEYGNMSAGFGMNMRYKTKDLTTGNTSWEPTRDLGVTMEFGAYNSGTGVYEGTLNVNGDKIKLNGATDVQGQLGVNGAFYMNGTQYMGGTLDLQNNDIIGVNTIKFNDPGALEGIEWVGGSGWKIYESSNSLNNTSGNLQFVTGSTRRITMDTAGNLDVTGAVTTSKGATMNGVTGTFMVQVNGVESLRAWNNGTQVGWTYGTAAFYKYDANNGRFAAMNYNETAWTNIGALGWYTASSRKWKKDVVDYADSALSKVRGLKVRKYKMADVYQDQRDKIGLIADEVPAEFLSEDGEMIDMYPLVATLARSVQELADEVDQLRKVVKK